MKKKRILVVFLLLLLLTPVMGLLVPAEAQEPEWELVERGENFIRKHKIGTNTYSWESQPMWVFDGSNYVPYIYEETADYYQVQSGLIAARIFDYYAVFYSPDMGEVRLYDERWEVQRWTGSKWSDVGAQSGSPTFSISQSETGINITKSFTSWAGTFEIRYIFREGSALKHEVVWTSSIAEVTEFRVIQKWAGIVAAKVKHDKGESVITSATTVNSSQFRFLKEDGNLSVYENQWSMYYGYNETTGEIYVLENKNLKPVEIDIHAQGLKTDFVFGNWIIAQDERLEIDPATVTYYSATGDGQIEMTGANEAGWSAVRNAATGTAVDYTSSGANYVSVEGRILGYPLKYRIRRIFFPFDTSGLTDGAIISAAELRVYVYYTQDDDNDAQAYLAVVQTSQPSTSELTTADFDAIGTTKGSGNYDITTISGSAYLIMDLNAAGKGWIDDEGWTKLGVREGHDIQNIPIATAEYTYNHARVMFVEGASDPTLYITYVINEIPTITSASISDRDDTDNVYAMESYYSFVAVVNDADGATDIEKVYLRGKNGAAVLWEVRADSLTGAGSWTIQTGATIIDLDAGSCTFGEAGDVGTATFKVRTEWDHGNLADLELAVYVEDSVGQSAGWTDKQTNYWDAINRLVTSNLAVADGRINKNTATTFSGNVYYATTVSGDTASAKFPLDAQFTAVHIHNAAHVSQGNDPTIVNGAFSGISVTVPDAVQSNTYHVYLDLVADYTDADAPDGDTVAVIGDRIHCTATTASDNRDDINDNVNIDFTLKYDFDEALLTDGTTTIEGFAASHQGSGVWRITRTSASVTSVTYNEFTSSGNTYGITAVSMDGQSGETVIWDRIHCTGTSVSDLRDNVGDTVTVDWTLTYDFDEAQMTDGTVTIEGVGAAHQGAGVWRISPSYGSVTSVTYNEFTATGNTHGITEVDAAGQTDTVVWDRLEIVSVAFDDSRVDISGNAEVRYVIRYDFDNVQFDSGKGSIVGFVWDAGNFWWDKTVTAPASPGFENYDENDVSITDSTYGLTAKEDDAGANLVGDRINFKTATLETTDAHINSDATGEWYAELLYEYDSAEVTDGTVTLNTGSMSWDAGDGRWEYTNAPGSVTDVARNIASVAGNTYGITALNAAVSADSETIEFDEVVFQVGTFSVTDGRINVDATGEWHVKLMLDNNDAAITSGTITLNTGTMSYDGGDSRWEYTLAPGAVSSVSRNVASVSGITGDITKINAAVTGDSEAIIFDQIEIVSVAFDDSRININTAGEVRYVLRWDFDDVEFGAGQAIVGFTWDAGNSWWDKAVTSPAAPGHENYDENDLGAITDNTYGITALEDDAGSNFIGDRIKILSLAANTSTPGKGDNVLLYATAELEYDNHGLGAGDSLNLESTVFTWSAGNSRWEAVVTSAIDETITYNEFTSGNEATYTITVGNINGQTVSVDWGQPPTITSATITDLDDTDNLYAMKKYYAFQVVVNDEDGALDISMVYLQIKQGAAVRAEVRATDLDTTPTVYAIQTGATIIDLDTGTCSWGEANDVGTLTFKIRFEWDYTQEDSIELSVYVEDVDASSAGFTVMQTNYADIVTRLTTTGVVANATYVTIGSGVEISGSVRYSTTIDGDTSSSSYPPDAQFTDVAVHNTTHDEDGTDVTIVNGVFAVEFTIPGTIGTFTYHIYLDLVADYTDADAPDGDTVIVYGVSAALLMSFDQETGATAEDVGGDDNDGAINGSTRTGEGYFGKALSFDGVNDYVNVTDDNSLDITPYITISVRIKTSDADFQTILLKDGAYGLSVISNFGIRMTINATNVDTAPNVFTSGVWASVTATFNGTHVRISIDGVLNTTQAVTGVIAVNANHLFIGRGTSNWFNGTIDEVRVYIYAATQAQVSGLVGTTIATFPYNLQGNITDMDAGDWVLAEEAYYFEGIYVRQNASYPLDTIGYRFYDTFSLTTMTFDFIEDDEELISAVTHLMVYINTSSGNEFTVTWQLYVTDGITDALDVDIYMYCNDTSARSDGYEIVEADHFNTYSHGGIAQFETSGDGVAPVAGEGVFGLAAANSTENSWAYANTTWRKLQHVTMRFTLWSNTGWDVNGYWQCPEEHNNTGYVEYGINYWHDGAWLEGWKVRLTIEDGKAGTYGLDNDHAWVNISAAWYNRDVLIKTDYFLAYYEAIRSVDVTTQITLYLDLWVNIEGASSTVGGRVNAQFFGMNETGWGPWADWSPRAGLLDTSVFHESLRDADLNVIHATELEMFTSWALINKTSPDNGDPTCDSHQWAVINYESLDWRRLSPGNVMIGISTPGITDTVTPGDVPSMYALLVSGLIEGGFKPLISAVEGARQSLYFFVAAVIDQGFLSIIGIPNVTDTIISNTFGYAEFFIDSVTGTLAFVVQIFRIISGSYLFVLTWLTRMITVFLRIWTIAGEVWSGTNTLVGGMGSLWDMFFTGGALLEATPIFIALGWFVSIDDRAKKAGGGHMSFLIGDLQMVSWMLSFFIENMSRVVNTVMNRVFQFINAARPRLGI